MKHKELNEEETIGALKAVVKQSVRKQEKNKTSNTLS
jgi:hypothetical protein